MGADEVPYMSNIENLPTIVAVPGVVANDGHEHFSSPRNLIAFAVVVIFAASVAAPYFWFPKDTQAINLVMSGAKTVETIMVLVLGFYFGTTVNAARKDAALQNNAAAAAAVAAAPAALPAPDPGLNIHVDPPATIDVKDTLNAQPDAIGRASPPADPAGGQGFSSGPRE